MNQRDRAFLHDMVDFISINRVATALALLQVCPDPDSITQQTGKSMGFLSRQSPADEIGEFVQEHAGNVQSVMVARIYAELFAGYEDVGALGSAIKHRKNNGIFARYLKMQTNESASFLVNVLNSDIPNHPEMTLDRLLNLPSLSQVRSHLPVEVVQQLENYYLIIPNFLHEVAKHYRTRYDEAQTVTTGEVLPSEGQINTTSILAIILGFAPNSTEAQDTRRLYTTTFNRIKHQFLVTGNLHTYVDPTDARRLEYAQLRRDQDFTEGVLRGIINNARVMSDFAGLLLLFDHHSIEI